MKPKTKSPDPEKVRELFWCGECEMLWWEDELIHNTCPDCQGRVIILDEGYGEALERRSPRHAG